MKRSLTRTASSILFFFSLVVSASATTQLSLNGGPTWYPGGHGSVYTGSGLDISVGGFTTRHTAVSFVVRYGIAKIGTSNTAFDYYDGSGRQTSSSFGGILTFYTSPKENPSSLRFKIDGGFLIHYMAVDRNYHTPPEEKDRIIRYDSMTVAPLIGAGIEIPFAGSNGDLSINLIGTYVFPVIEISGRDTGYDEWSVRLGVTHRWSISD